MSTTTHRRPRPRPGKRHTPDTTPTTQTTTTATTPTTETDTPTHEADTPPTRPRLSKPTRPKPAKHSKPSKPTRLSKPSKPSKPSRLSKPAKPAADTTPATPAADTTPATPAAAAPYKVTTLGVLRSEWTKFWSLRSSWATLGVAVVLLVVFGAIAAYTYSPDAVATTGPGGDTGGDSDAVSLALTGVTFGALAIGVLGVLLSAGEYTTGMIRSTFAAVPRRLPVLFSKAAVIGPIALILSTLGALAAFQLGTPGLDGQKIALTLSDDGVLRSLAGAGLYLGLVAIFGVALGVLIRSSAGAIAALVGILLVLPGLASLLPDSWYDTLSPYFPSNAGSAIYSLHQASDSLTPGAGLAVFAGWVTLTLAAAAYRLAKTDA